MNNWTLSFDLLGESIGWSLIHSLWQGALIGLVLFVVIRFTRRSSANLRFNWALAALFAMVFSFLGTLAYQIQVNQDQAVLAPILLDGVFQIQGSGLQAVDLSTSETSTWAERMESYLPIFSVIWFLGVVFCLFRFTFGFRTVRILRTKGHLAISSEHQDLFDQLISRLSIRIPVRMVWSGKVDVPMVIGHFKPLVLFPISLVNKLDLDQVEAILLHELGHVIRRDYLWNCMLSFAEILFFYHPVFWFISNQLQKEREHACDDLVLTQGISSKRYASTLADVLESQLLKGQWAIAFSGKKEHLLNRIKRIISSPKPHNNMYERVTVGLVVMLCIGFLALKPVTEDDWNLQINDQENSITASDLHNDVFALSADSIPPKAQKPPKPPKAPKSKMKTKPPKPPKPPKSKLKEPPAPPAPPTAPEPPSEPTPDKGGGLLLAFTGDLIETLSLASIDASVDALEIWENDPVAMFASFQDTIPPKGEKKAKFEADMEKFAKRMEKWGEEFGEKWGKEFENFEFDSDKLEKFSEEMAAKAEAFAKKFEEEGWEDSMEEFAETMAEMGEELGNAFGDDWAENIDEFAEAMAEMGEELAEKLEPMTEELELGLKESLEGLEETLELHFDALHQDLIPELKKDGFIKKNKDEVRIDLKNRVMKINGKKLTEKQKDKYLSIINEYIDVADNENTSFSIDFDDK